MADTTTEAKKENSKEKKDALKEAPKGEKPEASKGGEPKLSPKMQEIISSIEGMNVLDLSELVKALEKKFGVTAAAPVAVAVAPGGGAPAEEVKESVNVVLAGAGSNKISVIKEIRTITTLGLKEAKDLVEGAPKTVKEDVPIKEAEEIKKKLEGAGAKVELK